MMTIKTRAISAIIIATLLGWLLPTIYLIEFNAGTQFILPGLYFEQIIGILFGFILGILIATFIVRAAFLEKIRHETFSFVGLGIALFTFFANVVFPRFIPASLFSYVTPAGETIPPPDSTSLSFAVIVGIILAILIAGLILRITRTKLPS
jgi:hypothetical protein